MAVSSDMLESWRRPRAVMRRLLAGGAQEGRALAVLMGACFLIYVAQWPRLAREAHLDPAVPLDARLGITMFALLFLAPLIFYALAAMTHLMAKIAGGTGSFFRARMALFWALLAVSPVMLLQGLVAGLVGPGPGLSILGVGVLAGFLWIWLQSLRVAEFEG